MRAGCLPTITFVYIGTATLIQYSECMTDREASADALQKVLASAHFANARRLSDFLRFVTLKAAAGETVEINEHRIAFAVYGRGPDYDPRMDSIVHVEANRLRARLHDYYETDGRDDAFRIHLPRDSYVPVYETSPPAEAVALGVPARSRRLPWLLGLSVVLAAVTTMAGLVPLSRRTRDSRRSVAVLPFINEGGLPGKDYFSDGLAERITGQLGRTAKLNVAASSSAQQIKEPAGDVRRIGERLHVDLVLRGGVRFAENKIGVSARIYDTHTGRQIWASEFSRPSAEMLELQDEISTAIAAALDLGPAQPRGTHAAGGWTNDPEALDLYLQARYLFNSRKLPNLWKSVQLYDAALKKDPKFALAYAGEAEDYVVLAANEDQDMSPVTDLAKQAVRRALEIDPNLPEALLTKAATVDSSDFPAVERAYRAALEANPSSANAHHWWAINLLATGRFSEAEAELRRAQLLDPLSLYIGVHIGTVYYCSRRYQDTIDLERRLLELDPRLDRAPVLMARGYEGLGRYAEAEAILERVPKTGNFAPVLGDLGHVYAVSGKRERALRVMEDLTRVAQTRHVSPQYLALVQTGLGNKNEALALLEMSFEQHEAPLALLKVDPRWDPLRGDPRFQQLLHALSLDK